MTVIIFFVIMTGFVPQALSDDVEIEYTQSEEKEEEASGVERIVRNPVFASGLAAGTTSINRSIDSLMESLFYNLVDHDLVIDLSDDGEFHVTVQRDVHPALDNHHVVVDRFSMGPDFETILSTALGYPLTLGGNARTNILNIYLASDEKRLADRDRIDEGRYLVNNWFGLLPILSSILPPSFNPSEMYDPLSLIESPFEFPETISKARQMPIGNIMSYSVSGSMHFGTDLLSRITGNAFDELMGVTFDSAAPVRFFNQGNHQVSVLRKSDNIFWVGLSTQKRVGQEIGSYVKKIYFLFNRVTPFWIGLPATILPVDISLSDADISDFNMIYEFDFNMPKARQAFELAVRGDFSLSQEWLAEQQELGSDNRLGKSGVRYILSRMRDGREWVRHTGWNIFIQHDIRRKTTSEFTTTTEDSAGRFHSLDARTTVHDDRFDLILGPESVTYESRASIQVDPVGDQFRFASGVEKPIDVVVGLNIRDKSVDAWELDKYLNLIKNFSKLPLKGLTGIPVYDVALIKQHQHRLAVADPLRGMEEIVVTPTYLGRFYAQAGLRFNSDTLTKISMLSEQELWQHFLRGYGLISDGLAVGNQDRWQQFLAASSYMLSWPLILLNLEALEQAKYFEIRRAIAALKNFEEYRYEPLGAREALRDLFSTDFMLELTSALTLAAGGEVPSSVSLQTKPKVRKNPKVRQAFEAYNNKLFRSTKAKIELTRQDQANDIISQFDISSLHERRKRPLVEKVRVFVDAQSPADIKPIQLQLRAKLSKAQDQLMVFVRIEQAGKVNLGRFVLFEDIVTVAKSSGADNTLILSIGDIGADVESFALTQALSFGGDFSLTFSISLDGDVWSDEKELLFTYLDGQLFKMKD